jgi:adenylate kinase
MVSPLCAAGPIVLLVGPPGSGRTTQAEILKKERGMPVIAADDLIAHNQQAFERGQGQGARPADHHLDPAVNNLVEKALSGTDLSNGVVLDGYPATRAQAEYFAALGERLKLPRPIVVHLNLPDRVARKRLKSQKARNVEQQIKEYHRELDFAREYFPQSDIHDVDAAKKPDDVAKQIRTLLQERKD